jgi:hypothetical protein
MTVVVVKYRCRCGYECAEEEIVKGICPRCTKCLCGKVRYRREVNAKTAVRQMRKKGSFGLQHYLCDICEGWHIGHRTRPWRKLMDALRSLRITRNHADQS